MLRLCAFLAGVAAALALFFQAPELLKDNPAKASYWIAKLLTKQDGLLEQPGDKPRLVIVAGSNGLYGYDGEYLERYSGYDVVNFATHVGFDLGFHEQRLRGRLRQGDVVLAPLEHLLYRREAATDFHQEQNLLWLQRFFHYDTPLERIEANLRTPSEIYLRLAMEKLTGTPRDLTGLPVPGNDGIAAPEVMHERLPLHVSLADRHGFFVLPLPQDKELTREFASARRPYSALSATAGPTDKALEDLAKLKETVQGQGATLLLTWPAMADIPSHPRQDERLVAEYRGFQRAIAERGYRMICDPAEMFLPAHLFQDTVYHVNAWGAIERSIRLAQCMAKERLDVSPEVAQHTLGNQLEVRETRTVLRAPFERAMDEIAELRDALAAYKAKYGEYPVSSGNGRDWDGLHSKWGVSTENWIDGLAPTYVSALPRDWRKSRKPDYQYLYRSNGRFYKIMNRRPPDCELAKQIMPEIVDPSRDCWAYGTWVGIARTW